MVQPASLSIAVCRTQRRVARWLPGVVVVDVASGQVLVNQAFPLASNGWDYQIDLTIADTVDDSDPGPTRWLQQNLARSLAASGSMFVLSRRSSGQ